MPQGINIGGIYADLDVDTGNLEQGLAKGRQAMAAAEAELQKLDAEFNRGAISQNTYTARSLELAKTMSDLATRMQAANSAIGVTSNGFGVYNAGISGATGATKGWGQSLNMVGYAVDDLQYGFKGISNNIQPILMATPGLEKFAGPISIAAIAAYQLYTHWDQVRASFGDTTPLQEAMRSLEGVEATLKRLKEDAASTSFWESYATNFGFNVDAGKAGQASDLAGRAKDMREAEANARSLEGHHSPAQTKAAEHLGDAMEEAGGMEGIADELAKKNFKEQGVGSFLSVEKSLGGFGPSQRDEYRDIQNKETLGIPLDHDTFTRKADLEEMARQRAEAEARFEIGRAKFDTDAQKRLGEKVGGAAGDLIAGTTLTEKEAKKDAEAKRLAAEKAERDRKKYNELSKLLTSEGNENQDFGDAEVKRKEQAEKAEKKRIGREALEKAKNVMPGVEAMTEQAIMADRIKGGNGNKIEIALAEKLAKLGMSDDEAIAAAGETMEDARRKVGEKVANFKGDRHRDGQRGNEEAKSETYSTASLTQKIQAGVGTGAADHGQKQVDLQTQMVAFLAAIEKQKALRIEVRK